MSNIFNTILIVLLGGIILSSCSDQVEVKSPSKEQIQEGTGATEKLKTTQNYNIRADDMVYGNPNSSVILVEYFSPTCPHCVLFHKKIFPELEEKYIDTGKIAYVMREFIGNKQDLDAAVLARCLGDVENYSKFIHVILEQQDNWAFSKNYREILTSIAGVGGVSPEKYAACLNDEAMITTLIENTKLVAKEPRFIGTPSFFINGKQFLKPYTTEELSNAIEEALSNAH